MIKLLENLEKIDIMTPEFNRITIRYDSTIERILNVYKVPEVIIELQKVIQLALKYKKCKVQYFFETNGKTTKIKDLKPDNIDELLIEILLFQANNIDYILRVSIEKFKQLEFKSISLSNILFSTELRTQITNGSIRIAFNFKSENTKVFLFLIQLISYLATNNIRIKNLDNNSYIDEKNFNEILYYLYLHRNIHNECNLSIHFCIGDE